MNKTKKEGTFVRHFKRDWQLWLLCLIPLIYVGIFCYGPMYGIQIAFKSYNPSKGIWGSPWIGWKWFEKFLTNVKFGQVFWNTLAISLYSLCVGFPLPIIFALMLNTLTSERFKKVTQTISYLPHFIAMTVAVALVYMILSPINGIYGNIFRLFGGEGYPPDFRADARAFRHIYVWSGVWQQLGWSSIIYVSALASVPVELHDAAKVDGASRFKRIFHIDIPSILPTICIMLILRFGSIISVGMEKALLMQYPTNLQTSEIISTYVFKNGLNMFSNFSYGAAVGLFNNIINLVLLLTVNTITKKLSNKEISFF